MKKGFAIGFGIFGTIALLFGALIFMFIRGYVKASNGDVYESMTTRLCIRNLRHALSVMQKRVCVMRYMRSRPISTTALMRCMRLCLKVAGIPLR